jgi:hypothetical protein
METAQTRRAAQPMHHDVEDSDAFYETRIPSSARRYQQSAPPIHHDTTDDPSLLRPIANRRRSATTYTTRYSPEKRDPITHTENLPGPRRSPLIAVLVGMVAMVLLFMMIGALGSWWQSYQDDMHYGRPRTSQLDAVVGHNDSKAHPSHFIFLNLQGHINIMELPGGNASHTIVYLGPILYGDNADLVPVTGEIRDVNHDGKPDLIVHIQSQQLIFFNTGQGFKEQ